MEEVLDLFKVLLISASIPVAAFIIIKHWLRWSETRMGLTVKEERRKYMVPHRLDACQRLVLFLERIDPNNMVMRANTQIHTADTLRMELLQNVRTEFEHNVAQQIYLSAQTWDTIVAAKDQTVKVLNMAASELTAENTSVDYCQRVIELYAEYEQFPTKSAIRVVRQEMGRFV